MHFVFLYDLNKTYGIGILESTQAAVHIGLDRTWVTHRHFAGTDSYLVRHPSQLLYCEAPSDIAGAVKALTARGLTLAQDPRLPPAPEGGVPPGVTVDDVVPTLAAVAGQKRKKK